MSSMTRMSTGGARANRRKLYGSRGARSAIRYDRRIIEGLTERQVAGARTRPVSRTRDQFWT